MDGDVRRCVVGLVVCIFFVSGITNKTRRESAAFSGGVGEGPPGAMKGGLCCLTLSAHTLLSLLA